MFSKLLVACFLLPATLVAATQAFPKNAGTWSVAEVNAWMAEEIPHLAVKVRREFRLDGKTLLHITDHDLEDEFEMSSALKRKAALAKLHSLRTDTDGDGDVDADDLPNKGLFYFRTFHRRETDVHLNLLMGSPRIGIMFLNDEHSLTNVMNDNFPLSTGGYIWTFLSPRSFLAVNRNDIMGGLPWYFGVILWTNAIGASAFFFQLLAGTEAKDPNTGRSTGIKQWKKTLIRTVVLEVGHTVCSAFLYIIYPIIPWFICDLVFGLSITIMFFIGIFLAFTGIVVPLLAIIGICKIAND